MGKVINSPLVTVLMCVYNGEDYLEESVKSILNQSYNTFEFLIINDGSTDNTFQKLKGLNDNRIRLFNFNSNQGLIKSLNTGLKLSRGKYIARMDADDVSAKNRIIKQVSFLENHPEIGVCGSFYKIIGTNENIVLPITEGEIKWRMLYECPMGHPTVMYRKSLFQNTGLTYYKEEYKHCEDYKLWIDLSFHTKFYNIPEALLFYRKHDKQISKLYRKIQLQNTNKIRLEYLRLLKVESSERDLELDNVLFNNTYNLNLDFIDNINRRASKIYVGIEKSESAYKYYIQNKLKKRWNDFTMGSTFLGLKFWKVWINSRLTIEQNYSLVFKTKFFIKCLLRKR